MLELRSFAASDDASLISWVRTAEELLMFAGPSLNWPLDREQLEVVRSAADVIAWTAVMPPAPAPVGHVELFVSRGQACGLLARVILAPAFRGRGLGRALVAAALDAAGARGFRAVELNVRRHNDAAIRTYSTVGFRDVGHSRTDPAVRRMRIEVQP
jgi:GNAT superfamily N-acetyltransferase